jgi:hypothetical protein
MLAEATQSQGLAAGEEGVQRRDRELLCREASTSHVSERRRHECGCGTTLRSEAWSSRERAG